MEVEDRAKAKKLQEEADERCQQEAEEEEQGLDDTTLWLMDMVISGLKINDIKT